MCTPELLIGHGVPPTKELLDSGALVTLSVDTLSLTGTADLWSAIRLATGLLRAGAEHELAVGIRRMLELSTVDTARSLGLGEVTGSLTPGKRADLILVRVDHVGTAPFTDPTNTLALAAGAANVDTVVGRPDRQAGRSSDRSGPCRRRRRHRDRPALAPGPGVGRSPCGPGRGPAVWLG